MGYEPRLIAPFKNSLIKYFQPWLIGNDAFADILNAYTWRGATRKREGYSFFSSIPTTPVQGIKNWINPASLAPTSVVLSTTKAYYYNTSTQAYQDISFYVNPTGTAFSWSGATSDYYWDCNFAGSLWISNNKSSDNIKFWNGTPGIVNISGGWNIHAPILNGTTQLTTTLIILPYKGRLVALNTTEGSNTFSGRARWSQIGSPYSSNSSAVSISSITTGFPTVIFINNTSSFTVGTPAGILGVVGSAGSALNFNQFNVSNITPNTKISIDIDTTGLTYVSGGTVQGVGTTIAPTPYQVSIFGWRDDIPGYGGYIDADTSERIISAAVLKDILIVFFQRSTWRLRYQGNEILPFIWERINTQYGAESIYSSISFDEHVLTFSRYGWIAATTQQVDRIDSQIPDNSFSIDSKNLSLTGLSYVQGIRDYYRQFAYWTFPNQILDNETPAINQIYAYNYIDKSWTIFNPSTDIRCFGTYVETQNNTWSEFNEVTDSWSNFASSDKQWQLLGSAQNISFPSILGGGSNGNLYEMFEFQQTPTKDNGNNFNFSITTKRFNPYISEGVKCRMGYVDLYCTTQPGCQITFQHFIDDQSESVVQKTVVLNKRLLISISTINVGAITTIQTSSAHSLTNNQSIMINDTSGSIASIINNTTQVVTVINPTTFTIDVDTSGYIYTSGGNIITGIVSNNGLLSYIRIYLGAIAHMHQFVITLSANQVADPIIGSAQFEMHGIVLWTRRAGRIRG
jgi:hypothetical protein